MACAELTRISRIVSAARAAWRCDSSCANNARAIVSAMRTQTDIVTMKPGSENGASCGATTTGTT